MWYNTPLKCSARSAKMQTRKRSKPAGLSICSNPGFGFGKMSGLPGYPGFSKPGFQSLVTSDKSHLSLSTCQVLVRAYTNLHIYFLCKLLNRTAHASLPMTTLPQQQQVLGLCTNFVRDFVSKNCIWSETVEMDSQNLHLYIDFVGSSGVILSPEQKAALQTSLVILKNNHKFAHVKLWGKILGVKDDYYIAQGFSDDQFAVKTTLYRSDFVYFCSIQCWQFVFTVNLLWLSDIQGGPKM